MSENKSKSKHGSDFTKIVLEELKKMKLEDVIENIDAKKMFPFSDGFKPQFYAPFIVTKGNKKILVFTMTTMRSDRNKINQWDAFGIKNYFKGRIKVVVVLPDSLSRKEQSSYIREKRKIWKPGYLSEVDEICQLSELKSLVLKNV